MTPETPTPPLPIFSAPLRWEGNVLYAGQLFVGRIDTSNIGVVFWTLSSARPNWHRADTLAAAQSALVAEVMEMQGE